MSLRGTAFFLLAGLLLGGCESCRDSGPPRMSEGSGSGSGAEELIELEPNNDAAQATRLLVGKRTSGALDAAAADIDYFFIQSSEGPPRSPSPSLRRPSPRSSRRRRDGPAPRPAFGLYWPPARPRSSAPSPAQPTPTSRCRLPPPLGRSPTNSRLRRPLPPAPAISRPPSTAMRPSPSCSVSPPAPPAACRPPATPTVSCSP